jgi:hypothetical protein
MLEATDREELVRVLEREYDNTSKFIQGVVGTSFTIRGWAVAAWGALLGIAADQSSWEFSLFALLAVTGFAAVDAYHSWLYAAALTYSTSLERVTTTHYKLLLRGEADEDAKEDFELEARKLNTGLFGQIPRFGFSELGKVRPKWFFSIFYPSLMAIAAAVTVVTAV